MSDSFPAEPVYSWVATRAEQHERQRHARNAVGLQLAAVSYLDIDYRRGLVAPDWRGGRDIIDEAQWADPAWRYDGFDSVDHGVELRFAGGRVFSVTWDCPGMREGIGFRGMPLAGNAVVEDSEVAGWDVTSRSAWSKYHRATVTDVTMHYLPWHDDVSGFWCPRISLAFGDDVIQLILGQANSDGQLCPAADNIAILFPPASLPHWHRRVEKSSAALDAAAPS